MGDVNDLISKCRARVGQTLSGKWQLDKVLGIGGMAAVYAASHRNGGQKAAIKILHPEISVYAAGRERFVREAYIANKAPHDGIVTILDDDMADDGSPYLVMELLSGESLAERASRNGGRLPLKEALWVASQTLGVLEAVHKEGIIHRDLKPENLFLTDARKLKVLDFGLARLREAARHRGPDTGLVLGTPGFLAPEQALGRWSEVDERTDLWALGATVFNLLTGVEVHEGGTINERVIAAATRPPRSLGQVLRAPPEVVRIVDRALAFEPGQRYPDAQSMREDIDQFVATGGSATVRTKKASRSSRATPAPALSPSESGLDYAREDDTCPPSTSKEAVSRMVNLFAIIEKAVVARMQQGKKESARLVEAAYDLATAALDEGDGRLVWSVTPYAFVVGRLVVWEPLPEELSTALDLKRSPLERLPYQLFSAGVRALGVLRGISKGGFAQLLRILIRSCDAMPDDDALTMLWDAHLGHVVYAEGGSFGQATHRDRFEREEILRQTIRDTPRDLESSWRTRSKARPSGSIDATHAALLTALRNVFVVDDAARAALAARMELDPVSTGERYLSAAANALVDEHRQVSGVEVAPALRSAVDEVASAGGAAEAIGFVSALSKEVSASAAAPDRQASVARLVHAILSPEALRIVVDAARDRAAKPATKLEAILALLDVRSLHGSIDREALEQELVGLLEHREASVRLETLSATAVAGAECAIAPISARVLSPAFDGLPLEERRLALATLHALASSKGEDVAVELLTDNRLVPSEAHEETRELAAELLAREGGSSKALDALAAAAKARWKNSERVRNAAANALARAGHRKNEPSAAAQGGPRVGQEGDLRGKAVARFLGRCSTAVASDPEVNRLRRKAADALLALHMLVKTSLFNTTDTDEVERAVDQSQVVLRDFAVLAGGTMHVDFADHAVVVCGQLLSGSRMVYQWASELRSLLGRYGIEEIRIGAAVTRRDVAALSSALRNPARPLLGAQIPNVTFGKAAPPAAADDSGASLLAQGRAIHLYASALVAMRHVFTEIGEGALVRPSRVKRVAQQIVGESIDLSTLALTAIGGAHREDAARAVLSAILVVAIGWQITSDRTRLAELAMAALVADAGRVRLAGPGGHLVGLPREAEPQVPMTTAAIAIASGCVDARSAWRAVLVYEATWLERVKLLGDLYGGAARGAGRGTVQPLLASRIVELVRVVIDRIMPRDASTGMAMHEALQTVARSPGLDRSLFRLLVKAVGLTPVGSVVELESGHWAVVVGPSANANAHDCPRVRVLVDSAGRVLEAPLELDLGAPPPGKARPRVTRIVGPGEARFNVARALLGGS